MRYLILLTILISSIVLAKSSSEVPYGWYVNEGTLAWEKEMVCYAQTQKGQQVGYRVDPQKCIDYLKTPEAYNWFTYINTKLCYRVTAKGEKITQVQDIETCLKYLKTPVKYGWFEQLGSFFCFRVNKKGEKIGHGYIPGALREKIPLSSCLDQDGDQVKYDWHVHEYKLHCFQENGKHQKIGHLLDPVYCSKNNGDQSIVKTNRSPGKDVPMDKNGDLPGTINSSVKTE